MALIEKQTLVTKLAPPFDAFLATQLVDEFVKLERRYILRDWEPAELDGGHFCEILARILYHMDSVNLDLYRDFGECLKYITNDQVAHQVNRDDVKMLFMVLNVVHKFRSKRGVGHVSPTYSANHMDARYMMEAVRWTMVETLRVFWTGDREAAAKAIQELLRFDVPCVGRFENVLLVQRTDLRPEEEILVLLHYAGETGFSRTELGQHAKCAPSSVTRSLVNLTSPNRREVIQVGGGRFILTDLGQKHLRENLAGKLLVE
ncbi:MAG: hypothetical protein ACYC26_16615 [Phycisphaerales bacterium]